MKNFKIQKDKGIVSEQFLNRNIHDFYSACHYISMLPYKRNTDKHDILCVFNDSGGTCSTKHAVLRKLALENDAAEIKLILGIFKMDAGYTGKIKNTLEKFNLEYIPEAHNYLKIEQTYYDFTKANSNYHDFKNKLLIEKEIEYNQIVEEKSAFHQDFFKNWINTENLNYSLHKIWEIREQCIQDLQKRDDCGTDNFSPVCYQNSQEVRDEFKQ
ncbi:hypothetical protein [Chryseobacterium takakiae]|uniref:Uncharacterized protein n=1 Tax=Chryseobacterium takakiae TaxID=1302685 RepID=A0A1M5BCS7_9FLAO|nr:hypothetical protein [Chryseobacterium takakiae]SHF40225.1 hypothetical protein SAMN05444408_11842 [Chryseobacterium takakiae]